HAVDDPRLTTSGTLVGSPTYLAPEVIRGEQADAGSDLWALAASLYFAVEGRAAFERQTTAATMHAILSEVPYLTHCQGPLAAVITGLLNVTPQARLSTQQVRGLLARVTPPEQHTPTSMYTPPQVTRPDPAPPGRRPWWPFAAAAGVLVAAAFAGGWFAGRAGMVAVATDPAEGPTYTYGGSGADIPEFELSQNSCAPARLESGRSYTNSADCAGPHDFEVLYVLDPFASDDTAYPGEKELRGLAEASCALVFNMDEAIPADERGKLKHSALVPTRQSWDAPSSERSRGVVCLVGSRDGKQLTRQVIPRN
ncbi:protein kinase domain-containing protein, partial [Actinophytocola sp.]|uniref:protein kinase domain-containing protein n=1 Tax=Actinophytocola sp. TaxID=1872138 RepID=UPI00389AEA1B